MNKNFLVTILAVVQFSWCTYARPKLQETGVAIDLETLRGYVDGTWQEKYDDNLERYVATTKHNCDEVNFKSAWHYNRESSIRSDAFGHKSESKAVFGDGYEHENQVVYGTEQEHEGTLQIGETKVKYGGEASSSASYDETGFGGRIGPKVKAAVGGNVLGVGLGAGISLISVNSQKSLISFNSVKTYNSLISVNSVNSLISLFINN